MTRIRTITPKTAPEIIEGEESKETGGGAETGTSTRLGAVYVHGEKEKSKQAYDAVHTNQAKLAANRLG